MVSDLIKKLRNLDTVLGPQAADEIERLRSLVGPGERTYAEVLQALEEADNYSDGLNAEIERLRFEIADLKRIISDHMRPTQTGTTLWIELREENQRLRERIPAEDEIVVKREVWERVVETLQDVEDHSHARDPDLTDLDQIRACARRVLAEIGEVDGE